MRRLIQWKGYKIGQNDSVQSQHLTMETQKRLIMRTDVNCRLHCENKAFDIEADKKFMSYTSLVLL